MTQEGGINNKGCIFSIDTNGGGYTDLLDFNDTNGSYPLGSLTLLGKVLYGVTSGGGANNDGCLFSIDTNGSGYADLYDFNGTNGENPIGTLGLSGGFLYGMAHAGGVKDSGVIFSFKSPGLGINNENSNIGTVNVYPNPSTGIFTFQAKSEEIGAKSMVEVYNVLGEKVYSLP